MLLPTQDLLAAHAEGRLHAALAHESQYSQTNDVQESQIYKIVILDVIHDPKIIDDAKIEYYKTFNVSNINIVRLIPRNSIIGVKIGVNSQQTPMFYFPFLPSHLAMPCKAGEHVWAFSEIGKITNVAYWMWRVTEFDHVDDVNHSHSPRNFDQTFLSQNSTIATANKTPAVYDFQNGTAVNVDNKRIINPSTTVLDGDEFTYERLLKETDASKLTAYEAVPRYNKRPADLVLEGSNNALVVLGTDRAGKSADYAKSQVKFPTTDVPANAGCITLVVGRGQTQLTSCKKVKNSLDRFETGKALNDRTQNEGDVDILNDRSTVCIAQKTPIDTRCKLSTYNTSNFSVSDKGPGEQPTASSGDGAIAMVSDKIRVIARSDIEFLVTTTAERDQNGGMVLNNDSTKWAAIIVKPDGSIVIKPADNAVIKLGGDDANKAILCTAEGVISTNGAVTAGPIISTMGGSVGTGAAMQGVWASKVLVK